MIAGHGALRAPRFLRRREVERRRVDAFVAAIRATAPATVAPVRPVPAPSTAPLPRVELVVGSAGPVWALDEACRARLVRP